MHAKVHIPKILFHIPKILFHFPMTNFTKWQLFCFEPSFTLVQ